jgi:zinc protease
VVVRAPAELPAVLIGYHGVPATDPDRAVLDVLERVLAGGDSARLHEDLVREHEVATGVECSNEWGIGGELFWLYAQARPGTTVDMLVGRIDAVVAALAQREVPAGELGTAQTQLRAGFVRGLKTVSGKANQLGFFETVFGDYRAMFRLETAWDAVTAADLRRVAAARLVPARRTVVVLEPVAGGGGRS